MRFSVNQTDSSHQPLLQANRTVLSRNNPTAARRSSSTFQHQDPPARNQAQVPSRAELSQRPTREVSTQSRPAPQQTGLPQFTSPREPTAVTNLFRNQRATHEHRANQPQVSPTFRTNNQQPPPARDSPIQTFLGELSDDLLMYLLLSLRMGIPNVANHVLELFGIVDASNRASEERPLPVFPKERIGFSDIREEIKCPICIAEFTLGDEYIRLPCKHIFHDECVQNWLKTHRNCPVCRANID